VHGEATCEYTLSARVSPATGHGVTSYAGQYVHGERRGTGVGALVFGPVRVTFTGAWDGGPRAGVLAGDATGGVVFNAAGEVERFAPDFVMASGPLAEAGVVGADAGLSLLVAGWLKAAPGCLVGDCVDGDGLLARRGDVIRATFALGQEPIVHERDTGLAYERGEFPTIWLHGEGVRVWRLRPAKDAPLDVERGWFVAGEFVGDRAAFDAAIGRSKLAALQAKIVSARAVSGAAARARVAIITFASEIGSSTGITSSQRASLRALVHAARVASVAAEQAWNIDVIEEHRAFKRAFEAYREVHAADVVALDVLNAAATRPTGDGTDLAAVLRQVADVLADNGGAHQRVRARLADRLGEVWYRQQIERLRAHAAARRAAREAT
jgi:hypothetical protein